MAYVRFMNGANPLWDFISEMAGPNQHEPRAEGPSHPSPFDRRHHHGPPGSWGWSPFDFDVAAGEHNPWSREMPHRPHHAHPRHDHGHGRGPRGHRHPPPPAGAGDQAPPPEYAEDETRSATLQADEEELINVVDHDANAHTEKSPLAKGAVPDPEISTPDDAAYANANANANDNAAETSDDDHRHRGWHGGRRGRHAHPHPHSHGFGFGFGGPGGFVRRGGWGGHGRRGCRGANPWASWAGGPGAAHHHHPYARGPWGRAGSHHRRRGSGAGAENLFAAWAEMLGLGGADGFNPERLREAFADALQAAARGMQPEGARRTNDDENENVKESGEQAQNKDVDFRPAADIYDAASEYVVHFALPGAKKEDISLNWDAENSELNVAGVIAREGDEEVIKTLALDERDVGVFERKVKLGREGVDAEGISAKMENGLLVVRVPKRVEDEWTEVRQVDIE